MKTSIYVAICGGLVLLAICIHLGITLICAVAVCEKTTDVDEIENVLMSCVKSMYVQPKNGKHGAPRCYCLCLLLLLLLLLIITSILCAGVFDFEPSFGKFYFCIFDVIYCSCFFYFFVCVCVFIAV